MADPPCTVGQTGGAVAADRDGKSEDCSDGGAAAAGVEVGGAFTPLPLPPPARLVGNTSAKLMVWRVGLRDFVLGCLFAFLFCFGEFCSCLLLLVCVDF